MKPWIAGLSAVSLCLASAATAQTTNANAASRMKAIVYRDYGSPDVLRLEEVARPIPGEKQVLIRVRAASVNPYDWHFIRGEPFFMRMEAGWRQPKDIRVGVDFAGTVEAIGHGVTNFKPGDEVFGGRTGAFAEYVCAPERVLALKPPNISFEQAASVPIAGITALQGLRDAGKLAPGQKVLINGASGGVGTFAVQIAKAWGAEVTGVCSTRNVEMVRSIGADHVIDYTKEDFSKSGQHFDLILDCVGNQSLLACRRVLTPKGKYIMVGGPSGKWISPLDRVIRMLLLSRLVDQKMSMMLASQKGEDLAILGELMKSGKVTPVIDRSYQLSEVPEAIRYLEKGHARGKVVITVAGDQAIPPTTAKLAASGTSTIEPEFTAIVFGIIVVFAPIVAALALNRRFQRRNPGKRPYRWGYYFSIQSILGGIALGLFLDAGIMAVIGCGAAYAALAWFFARRRHWAWIALTLFSFNPVAWIINAVYLWRRWSEPRAAPAS